MLRGKRIRDLTEADLLSFVNEVECGKAFDYKQELHLQTGDERRGLLYDVTSTATKGRGRVQWSVSSGGRNSSYESKARKPAIGTKIPLPQKKRLAGLGQSAS